METPTRPLPFRDRVGHILRQRHLVILIEIILMALLVVFRAPGATLLIIFCGWLSLWLRGISWMEIGLQRSVKWSRLIPTALAIGTVYQAFSFWILMPSLSWLTKTPVNLSQFESLRGNMIGLIGWLLLSWSLAAFGEEMAFRGYLLNRLVDLTKSHPWAMWFGIIGSACVFGLGHLYQGITGVLETFVFAVFLGGIYLKTERNLWFPIFVHGIVNTLGFILIYLGVYP